MRIRILLVVAASLTVLTVACGTEEAIGPTPSPEAPSTLVAFNFAAGEFTEGVAVDGDGNVFASISLQGRLVRIAAGTNTAKDFGKIQGLQPMDFGLIGLTTDDDGNVYGCVISKNPATNGVWRFDAASGAASRVPGTEKVSFPNSVIVDGETIYITDTTGPDGKGAVWRVPPDGRAAIWAQGGLLAGTGAAGFGFNLGANGIDVQGDTVYVGVTETAKILAIPISEDGSAGAATVFADLATAAPGGKAALVDGIDVDDDGNIYVAAPLIHSVLKVSFDGKTISTVADANDNLDGPASVVIGEDAVYVANFSGALGEMVTNKKGPSIVKVPI
ncbi:MAG TPA: SMP-30/gluconolactonase/LRE family protein [Actinomycetota bacterium]|jgi:sugar lactone lactonase YvrE|nr:SMP-30/gluconolactonase/LRE family protein [Actinomycetota bacterium]